MNQKMGGNGADLPSANADQLLDDLRVQINSALRADEPADQKAKKLEQFHHEVLELGIRLGYLSPEDETESVAMGELMSDGHLLLEQVTQRARFCDCQWRSARLLLTATSSHKIYWMHWRTMLDWRKRFLGTRGMSGRMCRTRSSMRIA